MTVKNKMVFSFVLSIILTIGVFVLLAVAYLQNFPVWATLALLLTTVLTMSAWGYYYLMSTKHKEALDPKKKKYHKAGNRKESRRKRL
jgi:uncharacterized membrane protein